MDAAKYLWFYDIIDWLNQHAFHIVMIVFVSVVIFFVGKKFMAQAIKQITHGARHREWHRKDIEKRQKTLVNLFSTIWRLLVIFGACYAIFREIFPDINNILAPLFASAGIIGIVLGFGAQTLIKDFISGIFIISENQYRVGDIIEIDGFSGTVERIGTRSTVLRDVEGNVHYFPNGMVQHVINKTMGYSMARFIISLHPSSEIERVSEIIDEVGIELSKEEEWEHKVLEAPKYIALNDVNGNAIELIVAGKTQPSDQWAVVAEMRKRLLERFEKEKIKLSVQQFSMTQKPKK